MDRDTAQLADILVDWCGADLDGGNFDGRSQTDNAREVIKCLVFTLANDQTAQFLLARLVHDARLEIEAAHREDENR